jgi:16S rRNA (guanine966-N2)-methyltransferase
MRLRVIAGEFKGRKLEIPDDPRVRPITDRMKEAWFGILQPHLADASVVDLFSGSGALGFEALSRGARHVDFVEIAPKSLAALKANITALGVDDRVTVRRADAARFIARLGPGAYDVAFADPPFSTDHAQRVIAIFRTTPFAGILGLQHRAALKLEGDETRRYGTHALTFLYGP